MEYARSHEGRPLVVLTNPSKSDHQSRQLQIATWLLDPHVESSGEIGTPKAVAWMGTESTAMS